MWARFPLRLKITLLVTLVLGVASSAFGQFAYSGLDSVLTESSGVGAQTAASVIAQAVDPSWMAQFNSSPETTTRFHQDLTTLLRKLTESHTLASAAVVSLDAEKEQARMVVLLPETDPYYKAPGTLHDYHTSFMYREKTAGFGPIEYDMPGFYMAAWVPIKHGDEIVGMTMVATDVTDVKRALEAITVGIVGVIFTVVLLGGIASYKFATSFEKTAVTDGLMGIYNHKYFKQRLEEETAKAARYGQQTSLVLFDIDFFKRVNDTYGHATGDLVLKLMAKWVTDLSRNTDVVCRYGGEEIACILPHTGVAGAQEFAERLRLKVSQQVVRDPEEDAEFRVTVSVGVTQWQKGMTMMDMIKQADAALYHSKRTGRNRVTLYQDELLPAPEEMASKPERTKTKP